MIHGQKLGRRARQETDGGMMQVARQFRIVRRLARQIFSQQAFREQAVEHLLLLVGAQFLLDAAPVLINRAGLAAGFDIGPDPEAGQRRQIVGGG